MSKDDVGLILFGLKFVFCICNVANSHLINYSDKVHVVVNICAYMSHAEPVGGQLLLIRLPTQHGQLIYTLCTLSVQVQVWRKYGLTSQNGMNSDILDIRTKIWTKADKSKTNNVFIFKKNNVFALVNLVRLMLLIIVLTWEKE